ncbi:PIN/TRAM domain-containing protein [soil metagenome]
MKAATEQAERPARAPVERDRASSAQAVARGTLSLLGGILGFNAALLFQDGLLPGTYNLVYLTVLGVLVGFLLSLPLAKRYERLWLRVSAYLRRISPQIILAAGVGTTVALVITVLLNTVLEAVPGFTWYWSLLITLLLVAGSSWFFVKNRQQLALFVPRATPTQTLVSSDTRLKMLDTSAIIDGRINDIVDANFLDGQLLIPKFVLAALQNIADSSDPLRRNRGRRGLEVLDKLVAQGRINVKIISDEVPDVKEVDEKLIRLCQSRQAALITTDYNLNRLAALQNVRVLNVHSLANVMRAIFLPGERLTLPISKEGREPGQGLAYLDDGTMVVVEDGQRFVGTTTDVVVTSNLQTNMGRMIFARPYQEG